MPGALLNPQAVYDRLRTAREKADARWNAGHQVDAFRCLISEIDAIVHGLTLPAAWDRTTAIHRDPLPTGLREGGITADKITVGESMPAEYIDLRQGAPLFMTTMVTEAQAVKRERTAYFYGADAAWRWYRNHGVVNGGLAVVVQTLSGQNGDAVPIANTLYPLPTRLATRVFEWKTSGLTYEFRVIPDRFAGDRIEWRQPSVTDAWTTAKPGDIPTDAALYEGLADLMRNPTTPEPIDD